MRENKMKMPTRLTLSFLALGAMLLSACNMPSISSPTPDPGLVFTQATQTTEALPTNVPATAAPTIIVTQVSPTPTAVITPAATSTTVPTATPTVTATPPRTTCTDQIEFVIDVTLPDDTELLVGEEF